jgi:hypothetical protein
MSQPPSPPSFSSEKEKEQFLNELRKNVSDWVGVLNDYTRDQKFKRDLSESKEKSQNVLFGQIVARLCLFAFSVILLFLVAIVALALKGKTEVAIDLIYALVVLLGVPSGGVALWRAAISFRWESSQTSTSSNGSVKTARSSSISGTGFLEKPDEDTECSTVTK